MAGILETIFKLLGFAKSQYDNYQKSEKGNYTTTPSVSQEKKREEVKSLVKKVADTEYVQNLRVGRSWILPKMVKMCFDNNGNFSESNYYKSISQLDHTSCWDLIVRNYHALSVMSQKDPKAFAERSKWWNKEVAVAIAQADLDLLKDQTARGWRVYSNCKGGDYIYLSTLRSKTSKYDRMFFLNTPPASYVNTKKAKNETVDDLYLEFSKRIDAIKCASDPVSLYKAVQNYDWHRCTQVGESMPEAFVNAYAGDGAYSAMMTMVKYLGLSIDGLDRDASVAAIERKSKEVGSDGKQLFAYCAAKFFDKNAGGVFDYKAYVKR